MDKFYFDNREQRWKSVPDCAAHGLAWDARTQRCRDCSLGGLLLLGFLIWLCS